jgi:hypothetical protein
VTRLEVFGAAARGGDLDFGCSDAGFLFTFFAESRNDFAAFVEWRYTPKHGSWLDMAETELGVLSSQLPQPPHPEQADPGKRSRRLERPSKQTSLQGHGISPQTTPASAGACQNRSDQQDCAVRKIVRCDSRPAPQPGSTVEGIARLGFRHAATASGSRQIS